MPPTTLAVGSKGWRDRCRCPIQILNLDLLSALHVFSPESEVFDAPDALDTRTNLLHRKARRELAVWRRLVRRQLQQTAKGCPYIGVRLLDPNRIGVALLHQTHRWCCPRIWRHGLDSNLSFCLCLHIGSLRGSKNYTILRSTRLDLSDGFVTLEIGEVACPIIVVGFAAGRAPYASSFVL